MAGKGPVLFERACDIVRAFVLADDDLDGRLEVLEFEAVCSVKIKRKIKKSLFEN